LFLLVNMKMFREWRVPYLWSKVESVSYWGCLRMHSLGVDFRPLNKNMQFKQDPRFLFCFVYRTPTSYRLHHLLIVTQTGYSPLTYMLLWDLLRSQLKHQSILLFLQIHVEVSLIQCTQICKRKNYICWNYSKNEGRGGWRSMVKGVNLNMTYLI
jgi:hypothetical protein